jgi:hypothetical protein
VPAVPEIDSSSIPPPRRRWLSYAAFISRRPWVTGVTLLLLFTLGLRLFWGWRVSQALGTVNRTFQQRGEALDPQDVRYIPIPDDQNAWALIEKAAVKDTAASPANGIGEYPSYPPYPESWRVAAQQSEVSNAPGLDLARQARQLRQSQIRTAFPSMIKSNFLVSLYAARKVGNTVGDSALYNNVFFNDDFEAVERLRDLLAISRAVSADETLVGVLVATGIEFMTCQRTLVIAPALRFDRKPTRDAVISLIRELLDESREPAVWSAAVATERLIYIDYMHYQSDGANVLRPLLEKELLNSVRPFVNYGAAFRATDAETSNRLLEGTPEARAEPDLDFDAMMYGRRRKQALPDYENWYEPMNSSMIPRCLAMRYRASGERRIAAVSLAIRLCRADNEDRLPPSLDALAPSYLPAVPKDPFHADGRTLAYVILKRSLPDGRDRPLVSYDEGSTGEGPIDTEPMYDVQRDEKDHHRKMRQYRDMSRWSPARRRFDVEEEQRQIQAAQQTIRQVSQTILDLSRKALGDDPY